MLTQPRIKDLSIAPFVKSGCAFTYYPKRYGYDQLSHDLLEMKSGIRPDMEALFVLRVLEFITLNNIILTGIVRVLGSKEMFDHQTHPLHRVAKTLSELLEVPYFDEWLNKPETTKTATLGSKGNRFAHLNKTYTVALPAHNDTPERILVLDDIVTTQTTALEVHRALKSANPQMKCDFFAFAETFHQRHQSTHYVTQAIAPADYQASSYSHATDPDRHLVYL